MITIGLTGSIGMGKSTVASLFANQGVQTHDADAAVHAFFEPKHPLYFQITALFPIYQYKALYNPKTKLLRRDRLGEVVFTKEPEKRQELEALLHPAVRADQDEFLHRQRALGAPIALLEIPLLFETGAESRVDITITISCSAAIQKQRVLSRPGMSAEKLGAILSRQMPDIEKRRRADYTITTTLGLADTNRQVCQILKTITQSQKTETKHVRAYPYRG